MKQLLSLLMVIIILSSCSIERRHYLPGYHVEWRTANGERRMAGGECRVAHVSHGADVESEALPSSVDEDDLVANSNEFTFTPAPSTRAKETLNNTSNTHSSISHSPLASHHSPLPIDTLKKAYKPQQQYREIDPVGKVAVAVVLAGVALQKIAGILTWFEVIMPLSFGPGVFIPALIVAVIGLVLSAYSAWRVRKNPEKYKKSEWGKASLAILGWQILMSALFAWLLGGLPIG